MQNESYLELTEQELMDISGGEVNFPPLNPLVITSIPVPYRPQTPSGH